jgi:hypothetical protein
MRGIMFLYSPQPRQKRIDNKSLAGSDGGKDKKAV